MERVRSPSWDISCLVKKTAAKQYRAFNSRRADWSVQNKTITGEQLQILLHAFQWRRSNLSSELNVKFGQNRWESLCKSLLFPPPGEYLPILQSIYYYALWGYSTESARAVFSLSTCTEMHSFIIKFKKWGGTTTINPHTGQKLNWPSLYHTPTFMLKCFVSPLMPAMIKEW